MSDCDHEEVQEHPLYPGGIPTWRFSWWDMAGVFATGVGGLFTMVGQTGNLLAREFMAAANWSRQQREQREAIAAYEASQRAMARELESRFGLAADGDSS